jgi:Secretion system C-terminal sorting domain
MNLGFGFGVEVTNRPVYHQFRPLADLLNNPNWLEYDFFAGDYSVHRHTKAGEAPAGTSDEERKLECYWLLRESDDPAMDRNLAIGWVHNMNAYWDNSWYMKAGYPQGQEMLDCSEPLAQSITLAGFAEGEYHITYIPTWSNSTEAPDDGPDTDPDQNATTVTLDLLSNPLRSTVGSPMDTLHSDYAFVITLATEPFVKSLQVSQPATASLDWDFMVYPNPANDQVQLQLPDDQPKDIALFDLAGRQIRTWRSVKGPLLFLPLSELANGSYWVRVSDGASSRTKRLIVQ